MTKINAASQHTTPHFFIVRLRFLFGNQLGEMLERAIVGFLGFRREAAAGKLTIFQMILKAFAAGAATGTTRVRTGAEFKILLFTTHY